MVREKVPGLTGIYIRNAKFGKVAYYFTFGKSGFFKAGDSLEQAIKAREDYITQQKKDSKFFGDLFEQYIELKKLSAPSKGKAMGYALKNHYQDFVSKHVAMISSTDIANLILKKDISAGSKEQLLNHLKSFYSHLISEGIVEVNPVVKVRVKGAHHFRERFLSLNEVMDIIDILAGQGWFGAMAQALLGCEMGLRRSEMWTTPHNRKITGKDMGIRWENIDFDDMKVRLKRKGGKIHVMDMTERVASALRKLGPKESGPVFTQDHSGQLRSAITMLGLNDGLDYKDQDDRLRWVSIHTFRHTFGTYLAKTTKDLLLTSRMMNHSFSSTTQRYAHMIDADATNASRQLSAMYAGGYNG